MNLGFTKSKVEVERPVMLLLCVDALFYGHGCVEECGWNIPWTKEVCSRDLEEVQYDGL